MLGKLLLQLFAALGTGVGALLALLVEKFFRTEKLDEGLLRTVATLESGANDAQIAAVAVAVTGSNGVEEPSHGLAGLQESKRLPPRVKVALLTKGDEFFDMR